MYSNQPYYQIPFQIHHRAPQPQSVPHVQQPIKPKQELRRVSQPHFQPNGSNKLIEQLNSEKQKLQQETTKNRDEIKKFFEDFEKEFEVFELNIAESDGSKLFFQELDRKSLNLQNHIRNEISQCERKVMGQKSEMSNLCQNLKVNTCMRLEEDEAHFKGELNILRPVVNQKMDREEAKSGMQEQINEFYAEMNKQILRVQGLLSQQDGGSELGECRRSVQGLMEQMESAMKSRIGKMEERVNEYQRVQKKQGQEKKQLMQQVAMLKNKYSNIQSQMSRTFLQQKAQIEQLSLAKENYEKQNRQLQMEVEQQREYIRSLEQNVKSKENASLCSESTRPDPRKKRNENISLDDFADFNEHSLSESLDTPAKLHNPFLCNNIKSYESCFQSNPSQLQELKQAIQRRQLYNDSHDVLHCHLTHDHFLTDTDTGLHLLDSHGQPFRITKDQIDYLQHNNLIRVK